MFSKAMRIPAVKQGLHSAGTPYQGYNFDQAPYSLAARNMVTNGVAPDGLTSAYDLQPNINPEDGSLSENSQVLMNKFLLFNNMNQVSYDFRAYPKCGFQADAWSETDEHNNYIWYLKNRQGVPMVALNYTADLIHALHPQYARMAWDYLAQFSRDHKTGAIKYNPNAR